VFYFEQAFSWRTFYIRYPKHFKTKFSLAFNFFTGASLTENETGFIFKIHFSETRKFGNERRKKSVWNPN